MIRSVVRSTFSKIIVAFINFTILILCSRYLGVSTRGEISVFLLDIAIIQAIAEIYTGYGQVHFIPRLHKRQLILSTYAIGGITAIVLGFVLAGLRPLNAVANWIQVCIPLIVVLHTFNCIYALGRNKTRTFNRLSVLQPMLLLAGLIIAVFSFKLLTIEAYIIPLMISFLVSLPVSGMAVAALPPVEAPESPPLMRILANGAVFQLVILMQFMCSRYSFYFLPDMRSIGLFSNAAIVAEASLLLVTGIAPVVLSNAANLNQRSDLRLTLQLCKVGGWFAFIAIALLMLIPERLFLVVFSHGFTGLKGVVLSYSPSVLFMALLIPINHFLAGQGRQSMVLKCYVPGIIFTLAATPYLTAHLGLKGAVISANTSFLLNACCILFSLHREYQVRWKELFNPVPDIKELKKQLQPDINV